MKFMRNRLFFGRRLCCRNVLTALFGGLLLGIFVSTNVHGVYAQKKRKKKEPVVRAEIVESLNNLCIPQQTENLSVIQIDANSKVTVTAQTKNNSKILASAEPLSSLPEILSRIDKKSTIKLEADSTLTFASVPKALHNIRRITQNCVNIETSTNTGDQYVYIPPERSLDDNMNVKPNPLTLIVELKTNKKITLNTEDQGLLDNTSTISNKLKQIFSEREDYGMFREGTNEIEKTVFVKASLAEKFGNIIELIEAIRQSGASPIGLQIDGLENSEIVPPTKIKKKT